MQVGPTYGGAQALKKQEDGGSDRLGRQRGGANEGNEVDKHYVCRKFLPITPQSGGGGVSQVSGLST